MSDELPYREYPENNISVLLKNKDVSELHKPKNFKVDLYPNQLLYANFFREFEEKTYNPDAYRKRENKYISCISDPVGSGKSYSVLGFLSLVKESDKKDNITTHIVVPFKLIKQWESYLNNTDLKYLTVNTTKKLNIFLENKTKYNLVLFSNTFYNKLVDIKYKKIIILDPEHQNDHTYNYIRNSMYKYDDAIPDRIILDEYETMYYGNAFFTIERVYIISSTISEIFCYGNPPLKFIKYKTCKRNPKDDIPFNIVEKYYNYNSEYMFVFYTLKVSDLDIIKSVDINNFDTSSQFIDSIFKNKIATYKTLTNELKVKNAILNDMTKNPRENSLNTEEEIKKDIEEIKENINNVSQQIKHIKDRLLVNECLICLDEIKHKIIIKCCCISVCIDCSHRLTHCVYCKKSLKSFDLDESILSKLKILREDISFNRNSKIIILGNDIEIKFHKLKELAVNWFPEESEILILKGNTNTCNKRLDLFKNDEKFHILYFRDMSDIYGFNLEFVTDIILLANIEEVQYKQIVGRAYRYGRTCDLIVHSFKE